MALYKNLSAAQKERELVTGLKLTLKGATLPPALFDFPQLQELYLEAPALQDLPPGLSGWSELRVLQLRAPAFRGSLADLFRLPRLENLKVLETPLHPLRLSIGGTRAPLKFLTLKSCGLTELPLEIGELSTLTELHLPQNELKDLPPSFVDLRLLKRLNLDANELTRFPSVLEKMKGLGHLSIDGNRFSQAEKERIQRQFSLTVN